MSHNKLRTDKTCLNCNHVVDQRFCPNCGQENIDTRKTFYQLFVHFFEDLTHYENSFWKTIRNLIFKPASLTREYLSGKRMSYLAPIRLYIFISFVTFFIVSLLPGGIEEETETVTIVNGKPVTELIKDSLIAKKDSINNLIWIKNLQKQGVFDKKQSYSLKKILIEATKNQTKDDSESYMNFGYKSLKELDSIQKFGKPDDKENDFIYWFLKKTFQVKEGRTKEEVKERFLESFLRNIPKALFIYMPLFAFILWLFQNKKRWYYFDHGIFTLHYFSFLLLATLIMELIEAFIRLFGDYPFIDSTVGIINFVIVCYMLYYFFPAHHRFYGQSRIKTVIKGIIMFFINIFILSLILIGIALYSFINIH